jgi:hypothetical protein
VYLNDSYQAEYSLTGSNWGSTRTDAAPYCGGSSGVGFSLNGFFAGYPSRKISLYYKDLSTGVLTEMNGSPKYCSSSQQGYCY